MSQRHRWVQPATRSIGFVATKRHSWHQAAPALGAQSGPCASLSESAVALSPSTKMVQGFSPTFGQRLGSTRKIGRRWSRKGRIRTMARLSGCGFGEEAELGGDRGTHPSHSLGAAVGRGCGGRFSGWRVGVSRGQLEGLSLGCRLWGSFTAGPTCDQPEFGPPKGAQGSDSDDNI